MQLKYADLYNIDATQTVAQRKIEKVENIMHVQLVTKYYTKQSQVNSSSQKNKAVVYVLNCGKITFSHK